MHHNRFFYWVAHFLRFNLTWLKNFDFCYSLYHSRRIVTRIHYSQTRHDPPPKPEPIPRSETAEEAYSRTARNEAALRKTNKANEERRKKGPKTSPNIIYHQADARIKSRLFFALGNEGKKRILQQHALVNLNSVKFKFFHDACDYLFKREKNYIIERMQIYNKSHGDRESLESFYLRLAGQASKCG